MNNVYMWAKKYNLPPHAITELFNNVLGIPTIDQPATTQGIGESAIQNMIRLEASEKGCRLWRNNVGVLKDINGRPVRYGLCNESKQQNQLLKSHDLIGIRPVMITPDMVGSVIGQFLSREVKKPGWSYSGKGREPAQQAFSNLINSLGGDAGFATNKGTI